jgi:hypothetical protein
MLRLSANRYWRAEITRLASLPWSTGSSRSATARNYQQQVGRGKSHLEQVRDRRIQADVDRSMAEITPPRRHPEEFRDVWTAGPSLRRRA